MAYVWLAFRKDGPDLKQGLWIALAGHLLTLFFSPQLSDDLYRFIWDGMVMQGGIHPMAYTPEYLIQHPDILSVPQGLYEMLNSKDYYSVYPPVLQSLFLVSYLIAGASIAGNVLFLKSILLLVQGLILFLLYRLAGIMKTDQRRILLFALNPLIILEYPGNLHMDTLMNAGLLAALLLSFRSSAWWSGLAMALSILSKLVTVILVPFFPRQMYWNKMIVSGLFTILISSLIIWCTFGQHNGWLESVGLWFHSFEFNASLYYLAKAAGYAVYGYNRIAFIGPLLAALTAGGILWIWWMYLYRKRMDWSHAMLYALTMYLLLSTTVHPWYLGLLLTLSVISGHLYPVVWTYLVVLSYSHYDGGGYQEKYGLIAMEYLLLLSWMWVEWKYISPKKSVTDKDIDSVAIE